MSEREKKRKRERDRESFERELRFINDKFHIIGTIVVIIISLLVRSSLLLFSIMILLVRSSLLLFSIIYAVHADNDAYDGLIYSSSHSIILLRSSSPSMAITSLCFLSKLYSGRMIPFSRK